MLHKASNFWNTRLFYTFSDRETAYNYIYTRLPVTRWVTDTNTISIILRRAERQCEREYVRESVFEREREREGGRERERVELW